jgi:hypothetical protein
MPVAAARQRNIMVARDFWMVCQQNDFFLFTDDDLNWNETRPLKEKHWNNQSFFRAEELVLTFYSSSRRCTRKGGSADKNKNTRKE